MQNTFFFMAITLLIWCCGRHPPEVGASLDVNSKASSNADLASTGRMNFAVIWKWSTEDAELVSRNLPDISRELTSLWKNDVIENVYYDDDPQSDRLAYFANIAFFLKANSEAAAQAVLDNLTVVKKGIATYTLHPVGMLWLDRKSEIINKRGVTKSFVAVWTTTISPLAGTDADDVLKRQSDKILELWKSGIIENVYFDVEGTYETNSKTDFVFFVNAKTMKEAESICNMLPFFKKNIATYRMFQAGVFWMGKPGN